MTFDPDSRFGRTALLVGEAGVQRLAAAQVALFGLGGVGAYAAEAIARAGIGRITLVDFDLVEPSNLNRQLVALESTLGRPKVEVARERIADIHPAAQVTAVQAFAGPGNIASLIQGADFVIDAIDTVDAKVALLIACRQAGIPVVSCMGAARQRSTSGIQVADLSQTRQCPLARIIRQRLRKAGISEGIPCVYSEAPAQAGAFLAEPADTPRQKQPQGSISFVPGIVGLTAAGVVINALLDA